MQLSTTFKLTFIFLVGTNLLIHTQKSNCTWLPWQLMCIARAQFLNQTTAVVNVNEWF